MTANGLTIMITHHYITRESHPALVTLDRLHFAFDDTILLTSLTTIAGLLPLLTETSTQAQLLIPIVTSLVFGLASATLFSILMVPAFFQILGDWKN